MKVLSQLSVWSLSLLVILAGCTNHSMMTVAIHHPSLVPPIPSVNSSLLEGGITVAGSGVPQARVDVFLNGKPFVNSTIPDTGNFNLEVSPLIADQVVTATQTISGRSSAPSLPVVVKRATLTQIDITPALPETIEQGQTLPFNVRGVFSNGRVEAPLAAVTWSSATPTVATIDEDGTATGIHAGTTTIQATRAGITSGSATLTVQPLPPVLLSTLKGGDTQVTGTAEPTAQIQLHKNGVPLGPPVQADTQGQWHVQDLPMLTEADQVTSTQLVNAISSVTSTPIVVGPAVLTQIALAPAPTLTVERGTTHHFTATGTFSNGRVEAPLAAVTWSSATPTVATIDEDGTATGIHAGTTTIQATRAGITSGSATLTVQPLPPVLLSTLKGGDTSVAGTAEPTAQIQLHKNGVPLGPPVQADTQGQWHVQDLPMLTEADQVTSTQLVNAISSVTSTPIVVGPAVLTQIALAPAPTLTVERGTTHRFTATGTFSNGRVEAPLAAVTWASATPTVATIEADGTATGVARRHDNDSGHARGDYLRLCHSHGAASTTGDALDVERWRYAVWRAPPNPPPTSSFYKNGDPFGSPVQADAARAVAGAGLTDAYRS